jgi:hypothetical protein
VPEMPMNSGGGYRQCFYGFDTQVAQESIKLASNPVKFGLGFVRKRILQVLGHNAFTIAKNLVNQQVKKIG